MKSDELIFEQVSNGLDETLEIAKNFSKCLQAGDLLILLGPLGVGKTVFAKGIAEGLGVEERVVSPTFTLAREYQTSKPGLSFLHVDAYRINSDNSNGVEMNANIANLIAEIDSLGIEATVQNSVTLIEWGSGINRFLEAAKAYFVNISVLGDEQRKIEIRS